MADEQIFFLFSVYEGAGLQESLTRNYHAWCNGMKDCVLKWPEEWPEMLGNVPRRPLAPGQTAGTSMLKPSPGSDMKGLFTKYTWQYRMPSPISYVMIDEWTKSQGIPDRELLMFFQGGEFDIEKGDLKRTPIWKAEDVDWESWCSESPSFKLIGTDIGSSMLVPVSFDRSAVDEYYIPSVFAVCFPAFCYLLGKQFTAAEIEDAWLKLPIVKPGKKNRGAASHTRRKWKSGSLGIWT